MTLELKKFIWIVLLSVFQVFASNCFAQFDPSSISGLTFWYRGDSVGYSGLGPVIDTLYDLSGNGYHAYQLNGSKMPVKIDSILNGQSVIGFTISTSMAVDNLIIDPVDPYTLVCVIDNQYSGNSISIFLELSSTGAYSNKFALPSGTWQSSYGKINSGSRNDNPFKRIKSDDVLNEDLFYNLLFSYDAVDASNMLSYRIMGSNQFLNITPSPNMAGTNLNFLGYEGGTFGFEGQIAELIYFDGILSPSDSIILANYLQSRYIPELTLGADIYKTDFCADTLFVVSPYYLDYSWSDGTSNDTLMITDAGVYSLTVMDAFGYSQIDSINVIYPGEYLIENVTLCQGDSLIWDTHLSGGEYVFQWSTLQTDSFIVIVDTGHYSLSISDFQGCTYLSDTLAIFVDSFPSMATLGPDTTLCEGNFIGLEENAGVGAVYHWGPNNEITPQLIINTSGTYSLTVTNANNCTARDTIDVSILGYAPIADLMVDSVCDGDKNTFTDLSTVNPLDPSPIVQWEWTFGDGGNASLQNTQHLYQDSGVYEVAIEVTTAAGCSQIAIDTVQVYAKPVGDIIVGQELKCSGLGISFIGDSVLFPDQWNWNFDDTLSGMADSSQLQETLHSFSAGGSYNVTAIMTTIEGCVDTITKSIEILQSPIANFMYQPGCENEPMQFLDSTSNANNGWIWEWSFGDQNTLTGNQPNPMNTYLVSAYYHVIMVVQNDEGCVDTAQKVVQVSENPKAGFAVTDFCRHTPIQVFDTSTTNDVIVSWRWNVLNNENESTEQNPIFNYEYDNPNTYNMQLVVVTDIGCKDSVTKLITIHPRPTADFSFTPEFGAPPLTVDFTDQSIDGVIYEWEFGNSDTSAIENPTIDYESDGKYNIQLITYSEYGCADTAFGFIKVTIPSLDMAVNRIYTAKINEDRFLEITADLINFGTREVNDFDLIASTSDGSTILEKWTGELLTLEDTNYRFSAAFELINGELPSVVCVQLENPNGEIDANQSNNEYCLSLTEFLVFDPYPNPANDWIYLDFILPEDGPVTIQLYNSLGKLVRIIYDGNSDKGLNRLSFLVDDLSSEMYTIVVNYGEDSEFKKFIKLSEE